MPIKELLPKCEYHGYSIDDIVLDVEFGDGLFIVSEPVTSAYGAGKTKSEAIEEFKGMFVDLFEGLTRSEKILSKFLSLRLQHMRLIISTA